MPHTKPQPEKALPPNSFFYPWKKTPISDTAALAELALGAIRFRIPHGLTAERNALLALEALQKPETPEEKLSRTFFLLGLQGRRLAAIPTEDIVLLLKTLEALSKTLETPEEQNKTTKELETLFLLHSQREATEEKPLRPHQNHLDRHLLPHSVSENHQEALQEWELTGKIIFHKKKLLHCEACHACRPKFLFEATNPQTFYSLLVGPECAQRMSYSNTWIPNDDTITKIQVPENRIEGIQEIEISEDLEPTIFEILETRSRQEIAPIENRLVFQISPPEDILVHLGMSLERNNERGSLAHKGKTFYFVNKKPPEEIFPVGNPSKRRYNRLAKAFKAFKPAALNGTNLRTIRILIRERQNPKTISAICKIAALETPTPEEILALETSLQKTKIEFPTPKPQIQEIIDGLQKETGKTLHYYHLKSRLPQGEWRKTKGLLIQDTAPWQKDLETPNLETQILFPEINKSCTALP